MSEKPRIRCAVYTRKSHEEGLEQEYNSLDAQYDAGANYIQSQRHEGWMITPERYDDGGFTGGNLERPALKRLLADIQRGMIDVVVVYKIDRLSRSLMDFSKLVELFDKHNVTFVSVTQHFNTTTSMGRLTLNILLSFAQFEREITGERIRDKIASSKAKGMWVGGFPPLGYDLVEKKLIVNAQETEIVRFSFEQFASHASPTKLVGQLAERGYQTKEWRVASDKLRPGRKIDKQALYRMLRNPVYIGRIRHKDKIYDGQHQPIISMELWDKAQRIHATDPVKRRSKSREKLGFILRGLIFDTEGRAMTPSFTRKKNKRLYRYYVSTRAIKEGYDQSQFASVSADQIEELVITQIRQMIAAPEVAYQTYKLASAKDAAVTINDVQYALAEFNGLWDQLFPVEKNRIIQLLIERIEICGGGVNITCHPGGLVTLCQEMQSYRMVA